MWGFSWGHFDKADNSYSCSVFYLISHFQRSWFFISTVINYPTIRAAMFSAGYPQKISNYVGSLKKWWQYTNTHFKSSFINEMAKSGICKTGARPGGGGAAAITNQTKAPVRLPQKCTPRPLQYASVKHLLLTKSGQVLFSWMVNRVNLSKLRSVERSNDRPGVRTLTMRWTP